MDHPARQYYNPRLTAAEERDLLRCNYLLLQAGQAALGLIGPDLLGIAVEPRPGAVVLHFAVAAYSAELAEDLDDLVSELSVCLAGGPERDSEIIAAPHLGPPDPSWPGHRHAPLYLAKSPPR
ncbi:hypothetical protein RM844_10480 [Streptomyces sp. DSM 44915]|uniref:Uncharacterized protein n=1 Tax=Streptomyces chisholmiae TaxID=3075540 RepID=A0ABU2JQC3_9ACTN|nr:hypothetical protein [Streptomyces sp. DSM 44915]MDT0266719.1 hypothetical protein [Streptomyces sp. DSM 44915]